MKFWSWPPGGVAEGSRTYTTTVVAGECVTYI